MARLAKTLTVGQAIALAITTIVGSGLLVLPGLAYQQVGGAAVYAWLLNALLVVPLLVTFAHLGANFPTAGGVAGFVQAAFSRPVAAATEALLLGTFLMGGPAIAITGGNYFAAAVGGGRVVTLLASLAIIAFAGVVNYQGVKVSGRIQQFLAFSLVGLLGVAAIATLLLGNKNAGTGIVPLSELNTAFSVLDTIFFAFTGFEMLSFTAEEYRNPKRDFPIAVGVSFIIVVALYIIIALAVQLTLSPNDASLATAPIVSMLTSIFGKASGQLVAMIGVVIITTNLIGGSWAASRLVFASAREGLLPQRLSKIETRSQIPRVAVTLTMVTFAIATGLNFLGILPLSLLFGLAGQGFFAVNALSVIAYLKLTHKWWQRLLGCFTLVLVVAVMGTFGGGLVFVLGLMVLGFIGNKARQKSTRGIIGATSK
ncbi:MAG: amino acid permease [Desmonostoc vinosum HA7617-LM4]|jgi:amino acid efflux transporter|nr:amino acid permease [Desmonostoc vinosum HA7617-LM4]